MTATVHAINTTPTNELEDLLAEGIALKEQAEAITVRRSEIAARLADLATFKEGSNTGHAEAAGVKAKVVINQIDEKWNQGALTQARIAFRTMAGPDKGDEIFFKLFKTEYKPVGKKEFAFGMELLGPEFQQPILEALTTKPKSPSVSFERV